MGNDYLDCTFDSITSMVEPSDSLAGVDERLGKYCLTLGGLPSFPL
jgi:hypothetical protein